MAFHWPTFRTRALSSIVFVAVMLAGLFWNQWSFLILFSIIHFGCWWEYFRLVEKIGAVFFHVYTKLGLMLMGYGLMILSSSALYSVDGYRLSTNFSMPVSLAGFILLLAGIFQPQQKITKYLGVAALGLLYISISWGVMLNWFNIREFHEQDAVYIIKPTLLPIIVIATIWINDTMAYLVGSFIGRTPLSKISPKKTWEGTIAGIILSTVTVALLAPYLTINEPTFRVICAAIAFITAVMGTFGDLLESKLKRMAGVKDSGQMMPGHGGFLDRFDSLLIAVLSLGLFFLFYSL